MSINRDWSDARDKCDREGRCRVCRTRQHVEAAHTLGRRWQDQIKKDTISTLWVNPDSIVPLCTKHHSLYDARKLDLIPYMTKEEQADAVLYVGIERAYRRLSGGTLPNW